MRPGLRRVLHAASPVVILPGLWWEWDRVRMLLLAIALAAVVLETLRLTVPSIRTELEGRIPVWREREAGRLSGAAWLAIAFAVAARASMPAAVGGILAAAWADPAGSLIGRRFGNGGGKTVAGSLAVLAVATTVAAVVGYPLPVAVVAGLTGAACERWAVSPDDNCWLAPGVTLALVAFA